MNKRVALLIGNGQYDNGWGEINSVDNDVVQLGNTLKNLGFRIVSESQTMNLSRQQMHDVIEVFTMEARNAEYALFYFTGHGIEYQHKQYLMPIDFKEISEWRKERKSDQGLKFLSKSLGDEAYDLNILLSDPRIKKALNKIYVLDTCRTHFEKQLDTLGTKGADEKQYDAHTAGHLEDNTVIFYATASGQKAYFDKGSKQSPFTKALVEHLQHPIELLDVFRNVVKDVKKEVKKQDEDAIQRPWLACTLEEQIFLAGKPIFETPKPAPKISVPPAPRIIPPQVPKHRDTRTDFGIEMVFLQAGSFLMGDDKSEWSDEKSVHHVEIKEGFWMGKYPVTQGQYERIMGTNPSHFKGENRPVENVSWKDAMAFCMTLNEKIDKDQYRLPTEEEWEYACRAGTTTAYSFDDDARKLKAYAVFNAKETADVGSRQPNPWGLYDMHGNVWEWCYSERTSDYESARNTIVWRKILIQDGLVDKSNDSNFRVILRGGSWNINNPDFLRSTYRIIFNPVFGSDILGFRLLSIL